jgi:hypothetical protein
MGIGLLFTTCKSCGKSYLVGVNGKDVREKKFSGGRTGGVPFIAFGQDEIDRIEGGINEGDEIRCPGCGEMVKVVGPDNPKKEEDKS